MNRLLYLILFAGGIALIASGFRASASAHANLPPLVTDAPSHTAIWLLVAGVVAGYAGILGMFHSRKS